MKIFSFALAGLVCLALVSGARAESDDDFISRLTAANATIHSGFGQFEDGRRYIVPVTTQEDDNDPRYLMQKYRIELIKKVKPSIVFLGIEVDKTGANGKTKKGSATCTGFFTDTTPGFGHLVPGFITTNSHCVEDKKIGDEIEVGLFTNSNGFPKMVKGKVLAHGDSKKEKDIAFVQIEATSPDDNRPALKLLVDQLDDAESVIAIGNPYGQNWSITDGIISGQNRTHIMTEPFLNGTQTNAAINPGNSGGPLIQMWGYVVGINTAIMNPAVANNMGFAIPSRYIVDAIKQYARTGNLDVGYLGILFGPDPQTRKLTVVDIQGNSPAKTVGLMAKDQLLRIDDVDIASLPTPEDQQSAILVHVKFKSPGETISLTVSRDGATLPPFSITLAKQPTGSDRPQIAYPDEAPSKP